MSDNICTYCGQEGHRASHCPRRLVRPEKYNDSHARFLNELRDSGVTNMFGASPFLQQAFPGLTRNEAMEIVAHWMVNA